MLDKDLSENLERSYLNFVRKVRKLLKKYMTRKSGGVVSHKKTTVIDPDDPRFEDDIAFHMWSGIWKENVLTIRELIVEHIDWKDASIRKSVQEHWDAIFAKTMPLDFLVSGADYEPIARQVFIEPVLQALLQTIKEPDSPDYRLRYLTKSGVESCTDDIIMTQYRHIRTLWLSPTIKWQVTAPLQHLDAADLSLPIQLPPDLLFDYWTPDDKTHIWNRAHPYSEDLTFDPFTHANYCLRSTATLQRNSDRDIQSAGINALGVLTALRLIKPGLVQLTHIFMEAPSGASTHKYHVVQNPLDTRLELPITKYQLLPSDIPLLRDLIAGVQIARRTPAGLVLALNRFDQSHSRESAEDMIVDLTIALEGTLLAGLDGELSYRFALLGAALLANNRSPQETYDLLASVYKIRSKIVHGGQILQHLQNTWQRIPGISDPAQFVNISRDIARDILREYTLCFAKGHNPQKVSEKLMKSVIKALELSGEDISAKFREWRDGETS